MQKQDAEKLLHEISYYVQDLEWKCEKIEDDIPAIRVTFDMSGEENELSSIVPSLAAEEYVIAHVEAPETVMGYTGLFEIVSQVMLPLDAIDPSQLLILVNQANQVVPLGGFVVKYPFKVQNTVSDIITNSILCQKYTFSFSDQEKFSPETICEILLLLLEQKKLVETMITGILLGKPAAEVIAAFVNYAK